MHYAVSHTGEMDDAGADEKEEEGKVEVVHDQRYVTREAAMVVVAVVSCGGGEVERETGPATVTSSSRRSRGRSRQERRTQSCWPTLKRSRDRDRAEVKRSREREREKERLSCGCGHCRRRAEPTLCADATRPLGGGHSAKKRCEEELKG